MRTDFILDFETIGQCARKAPGIECSYTTFVWDRFLDKPYSFQELLGIIQKAKLDLQDQMKNYDFEYQKSDLDWWLQQAPEVRKLLKPKPDDLKLPQFIEQMIGYLRTQDKVDYWWSRSNGFDPVILDHMAMAVGKDKFLNEYIPYWRIRDTRTFIDAKFNFTTKNGFVPVADTEQWEKVFSAHDSRHDVAADILRIQAIHRAENDMEQVEI
jgi:hypothetical protein